MSDETKAQPTGGPWGLDERFPGLIYCDDATGSLVARCYGDGFEYVYRSQAESTANATHIVKCVNAYPDLVKALKGIREFAQGMADGFAADIQEGYDAQEAMKNAEPWNAVLAALSQTET